MMIQNVCPEARVDHVGVDFFEESYAKGVFYSRDTLLADIQKLQFPPEMFDVALCFHVVEHVLDVPRALSELHRVLAPDGQLLFEVPCSNKPDGISIKCRDIPLDQRERCTGKRKPNTTKDAGYHEWSFDCGDLQ